MGSGKQRYGNEGESSMSKKRPEPWRGLNFWDKHTNQTRAPKKTFRNAWSETSAFQRLMSREANVFPDLFLHKALTIFHCYGPRGCQYMKDYMRFDPEVL